MCFPPPRLIRTLTFTADPLLNLLPGLIFHRSWGSFSPPTLLFPGSFPNPAPAWQMTFLEADGTSKVLSPWNAAYGSFSPPSACWAQESFGLWSPSPTLASARHWVTCFGLTVSESGLSCTTQRLLLPTLFLSQGQVLREELASITDGGHSVLLEKRSSGFGVSSCQT